MAFGKYHRNTICSILRIPKEVNIVMFSTDSDSLDVTCRLMCKLVHLISIEQMFYFFNRRKRKHKYQR